MTNDPAARSTSTSSSSPDQSTPKNRSPIRTGSRSASTKIANLRAAFESKDLNEKHNLIRRCPSPDGIHVERSKARGDAGVVDVEKLRNELLHERELRQSLEERCIQLESEAQKFIDDIRVEQEYGTRQSDNSTSPIQDGSVYNESRRGNDSLVNPTDSSYRKEIELLNRQLVDLKKDIVASTKVHTSTTDSEFVQGMSVLHHEIQNWIVNHFRRPKVEMTIERLRNRLETIASPRHLPLLEKICQAWDPSAKMAFYQAVALCYIMEVFDDALIFGLPQSKWRKPLREVVEGLATSLSASVYNEWRSTTFAALCQAESLAASIETAAHGLAESVCITLGALTGIESIETQVSSLVAIIKRAISLSHQFRIQRGHYRFISPLPGSSFDAKLMDDLMDASEALGRRVVKWSTFPAVVKNGNEFGEDPRLENIIVKARVLCASEEENLDLWPATADGHD